MNHVACIVKGNTNNLSVGPPNLRVHQDHSEGCRHFTKCSLEHSELGAEQFAGASLNDYDPQLHQDHSEGYRHFAEYSLECSDWVLSHLQVPSEWLRPVITSGPFWGLQTFCQIFARIFWIGSKAICRCLSEWLWPAITSGPFWGLQTFCWIFAGMIWIGSSANCRHPSKQLGTRNGGLADMVTKFGV